MSGGGGGGGGEGVVRSGEAALAGIHRYRNPWAVSRYAMQRVDVNHPIRNTPERHTMDEWGRGHDRPLRGIIGIGIVIGIVIVIATVIVIHVLIVIVIIIII